MGLNPQNYNFGMQFNPADFGMGSGFGSLGNAVSTFNPIAAGANLLGSVVGGAFDIWKQNRQWKKQEEFYNKYQSPAAQMEQMAAAGINPNAAAAGIAGNGAGQSMSPTSTNSIGGELGSLIGNSYNSAVDAANVQAMTEQSVSQARLMRAQARGQEINNDILGVELGYRPQMLRAELEDKRQSALQKGQEIEESKQRVRESEKQVEVLQEQKETIIQERGLIEYEKEMKSAQAAAERAKAALDQVVATIDKNSPEGQYAYAVKDHGADSPEAKAALKQLEEYHYSAARGEYNADPEHYEFNTIADARRNIPNLKNDAIELQKELTYAFTRGEIDEEQYFKRDREIMKYLDDLDKSQKSLDKAFSKESYKNGYHTQWQNTVDSVVKGLSTGIGIGLGAGLTRGVGAIGNSRPAPIGFH